MSAYRQLALKLVLASALLGLLFHFVPMDEVGAAISAVSPGILAVAVLLQFLMRIVATPRMHVITSNQDMTLGYIRLFRIQLISQYYALMLPGTLAGGGATWLKYVQAGAGKSAAIAAVTLNHGIGTLVMMVTGGIAWLMDRGHVNSGVPPAMALAWSLVIFAGSLVVSAVGGLLEANAVARYLARPKALPLPAVPKDSES